MQALMIFGAPLIVLGAVILLYVLDARPVDARRSRGRADRRSW